MTFLRKHWIPISIAAVLLAILAAAMLPHLAGRIFGGAVVSAGAVLAASRTQRGVVKESKKRGKAERLKVAEIQQRVDAATVRDPEDSAADRLNRRTPPKGN